MQSPFFDIYRAGIRSATDLMKASLENTERLQQQQLDMVGGQLGRVTEFWTGLWRVAGDAQKSMIDRMQEQLDGSQAVVREAYASAADNTEDNTDDDTEDNAEDNTEDPAELAASQLRAAVGQARRRSA